MQPRRGVCKHGARQTTPEVKPSGVALGVLMYVELGRVALLDWLSVCVSVCRECVCVPLETAKLLIAPFLLRGCGRALEGSEWCWPVAHRGARTSFGRRWGRTGRLEARPLPLSRHQTSLVRGWNSPLCRAASTRAASTRPPTPPHSTLSRSTGSSDPPLMECGHPSVYVCVCVLVGLVGLDLVAGQCAPEGP